MKRPRASALLPPGRIVLLGSPVRGSLAARNLCSSSPLGRRVLGLTAHEVLLPARRSGAGLGARDLGVIAGSIPVGFGRFMGPFDSPSDGTVLVDETHLIGAKQHLTLRTTHSGMVYSAVVARETASFLRDGRFAAETALQGFGAEASIEERRCAETAVGGGAHSRERPQVAPNQAAHKAARRPGWRCRAREPTCRNSRASSSAARRDRSSNASAPRAAMHEHFREVGAMRLVFGQVENQLRRADDAAVILCDE